MCNYAPIVVFTYCRAKNTRETIESLLVNQEAGSSDIIIFSDAAKNEKAIKAVSETRDYIHSVSGFKSIRIVEREQNYGLAKNIIQGVTEIINQYGKAIILEDDMTVSPFFLKYMNDGLERYKDNKEVASIHGYMYPSSSVLSLPETFFIKGADCWGWATWKRAWDVFSPDAKFLYDEIKKRGLVKKFEFDYSYPYYKMLKGQMLGKENSWAICWYASCFLNDMYTLYPNQSMILLNGLDGVGSTHGEGDNQSCYLTIIKDTPITMFPDNGEIKESKEGVDSFKNFFLKNLSLKGKIAYLLRFIHIRL